MIIYESNWEKERNDAGAVTAVIERNLHKEIAEYIHDNGSIYAVQAINTIEKEVAFLNSRGFNVVYSLRIGTLPQDLKQNEND